MGIYMLTMWFPLHKLDESNKITAKININSQPPIPNIFKLHSYILKQIKQVHLYQ